MRIKIFTILSFVVIALYGCGGGGGLDNSMISASPKRYALAANVNPSSCKVIKRERDRCSFTISGTVSGLPAGEHVSITNNTLENLIIRSDGTFSFTDKVSYGGSFSVSVLTQPSVGRCIISGGTGSAVTSDITNVIVSCGFPASVLITDGSTNRSIDGSQPSAFGGAQIVQTQDPWGNLGNIMRFDGGVTSFISLPFNTQFGTRDFTIDLWFKPRSESRNIGQALLSDWNNASGPFVILFGGGAMNTNFRMGPVGIYQNPTGDNVKYDQWNHYAVTRSNGVFRYWLNGILEEENNTVISAVVNPASGTLFIGQQEGSGYAAYDGFITGVRIVAGKSLFNSPFTPPTSIDSYRSLY